AWDYRDSGTQPRRDFSWGVEDRCMVDMILKFIDQNPGQPYCIYSWTQGTHHPYTPYPGQPFVDFKADPAKWGNMTQDLGLYLNALRETDRQIGRLLDELRRRNLADSTIVVITGDHGEAFGRPHKHFGHTGQVIEEELHVPLIMWNPILFKNAGRRQTVGGHVDLSPTVLDLLGVAVPATWQGTSLFSPSHPGRVYSYGAVRDNLLAVRDGNLKYTLNVNRNAQALYDLQSDPMEQTDIAPGRLDDAKRLRQRLAAWVSYQAQIEKTW
ncbi:MAG: sulfatase, partial [Tepidisphaerales bacterium]